jgi:hypothetical protein
MPTNRKPRHRERLGRITPAALELFAKLEGVPSRRRNNRKFRDEEHELHRQLDLVSEWWGGCSCLDNRSQPPFRPWQASFKYWFRCKEIRKTLLAMCIQHPNERAGHGDAKIVSR